MLRVITKHARKNPGFIVDIEQSTLDNSDYRRVLFTTYNSQLVLMSVAPGDEIGAETHGLDQFIRVESGSGKAVLDNYEQDISNGSAVVVPAGIRHNIINTGDSDLKLYTVYSPPNHEKGTVHKTKADEAEEHFDGEVDV